ncbi:MAG TPA: DUF1844 domain-containing protein [Terriglobales bacterium]|nr:DUF1844 domain-containing protein [Terriglobales bacterium]
MAEEKKSEFTVTDKRKFTSEGERRDEATPEERMVPPAAEAPPPSPEPASKEHADVPPPPTAEERQAGKDAYEESRKQFAPSPVSGRAPQEYEMNFERLVSSLYMSGAMALGGMQDEGGKAMVDIIGARQTIDMLAVIADKTKGNLAPAEENLLQSCLFDLRMAYVQITNLIAQQGRAESPPEKK